MAAKDKTPTPNPETEEAFSRIPTYFGKVDLLVTAIGLLGGADLGKQLNELIDAAAAAAPVTDVQAARDAQQAAIDAQAAAKAGGGSHFDFSKLDDPRDAEISPIETEHEDADKVHGESVNGGLTDAAPAVPYTGAPEPEEPTKDVVIEAPADATVKAG